MIKYDGELISKARDLRKNSTPQENKLWYEFLKKISREISKAKVN